MIPYENISESDHEIVRVFGADVDEHELAWHRDLEDRVVEAIEPTDWMVQLDNKLPEVLTIVKIPAGVWHRVIKGSGDLKVKIEKTRFQNLSL